MNSLILSLSLSKHKRKEKREMADWNKIDVFSMNLFNNLLIHSFIYSLPTFSTHNFFNFYVNGCTGRWPGFDDISPVEILGRLSPSIQK